MSWATKGNFSFFKTSSSTNGHKCKWDAKDGNEDGKDGGSDNVLPIDSKPSIFSFPSN
jgi:hypothetical protein